jgi:hypothetical protein
MVGSSIWQLPFNFLIEQRKSQSLLRQRKRDRALHSMGVSSPPTWQLESIWSHELNFPHQSFLACIVSWLIHQIPLKYQKEQKIADESQRRYLQEYPSAYPIL